jgi:prevent-host-death family protein
MTVKNTVLDLDTLGDAVGAAVEQSLSGEPIILTRDGRPVAALVSIEGLRVLQRERELLRRLALGELESAAGEGVELESVLDDCRMLLEES